MGYFHKDLACFRLRDRTLSNCSLLLLRSQHKMLIEEEGEHTNSSITKARISVGVFDIFGGVRVALLLKRDK